MVCRCFFPQSFHSFSTSKALGRSDGEFDATDGFLLHQIRSDGELIGHLCSA